MNLYLGVLSVPKKQQRTDERRDERDALRRRARSSCNLIYRTEKGSYV